MTKKAKLLSTLLSLAMFSVLSFTSELALCFPSYNGSANVGIPSRHWVKEEGENVNPQKGYFHYQYEDGPKITFPPCEPGVSGQCITKDQKTVQLVGLKTGKYTVTFGVLGPINTTQWDYDDKGEIATIEVALLPNDNSIYELSPAPVAPLNPIDLSKYDIYYGDFNQDGIDGDIYLHGRDIFILIAGDISFPILLEGPVGLVYFRSPFGYSNPLRADVKKSELANYTKAKLDTDYLVGDLNGDGMKDYFIRGYQKGATVLTLNQADLDRNIFPSSNSPTITAFDPSDRSIEIALRDINLDGRDDLVQLSAVDGYEMEVVFTNTYGRLVEGYDDVASMAQMFDITTRSSNVTGTLGGAFRVSESGAAAYNIPVFTPEGTAGVTPSVSMSYSSQGGGGILGDGWSLNAYSAISRCRKTYAIDKTTTEISWNNTDQFCLDGQRLLLVSGSHGQDNAEYETEIDSYSKIKIHGTQSGEPNYFSVQRKDGSISYYGYSGGSAAGTNAKQKFNANAASTISWYLSRTEDNAGNPVQYYYKHENGKNFRLDRIEYAYGSDDEPDGIYPNTRIEFDYKKRPDPIHGYLAGYFSEQVWRLSKIDVFNRVNTDVNLRTYHIYYNRNVEGAVAKRSMVGAIQECVRNSCKRATKFDWELVEGAFSSSSDFQLDPNLSRNHMAGFQTPDINGDGVKDLVWLAMDVKNSLTKGTNVDFELHYAISVNGQLVKQNFAGGSSYKTFYENERQNVKLEVLDFNADGRSDIAVYRKKGANAHKWEINIAVPHEGGGVNWKLGYDPVAILDMPENTRFVDLDGDGLSDAIAGDKVSYLKRRSGAVVSDNNYYAYTSPQNYAWSNVTNALSSSSRRVHGLGDFNGDGRVDIVGGEIKVTGSWDHDSLLPSFNYNTVQERLHVLVQDSNGFSHQMYLGERFKDEGITYPFVFTNEKVPYVVDLNADGLSDILIRNERQVSAYLSTGTSFVSLGNVATLASDSSELHFLDFNTDGYQDFIEFSNVSTYPQLHSWNSRESKYSDTSKLSYLPRTGETYRMLADFDGDGLTDVTLYQDGKFQTRLFKSTMGHKNQVVEIDTGWGAKTAITYERLNDTTHYSGLDVVPEQSGTAEQCASDGPRYWQYTCTDYALYSSSSFYTALNQGLNPVSSISSSAPVLELNGPIHIVTKVENTSPSTSLDNNVESPDGHTGGASAITEQTASVSYYYNEAKIQAGGRGMLGFHRLTTVDDQTGIETATVYRQDFPFIGSPISTFVYANGGLLKESHNVYAIKDLPGNASSVAETSGTAALNPLQAYIQASYDIVYKTNSSVDSAGVVSVAEGSGVSVTCLAGSECPELSEEASTQAVLQQTITQTTIDSHGNTLTTSVDTYGDGLHQKIESSNSYSSANDITLSRANSAHNTSFSYPELGRLVSTTVSQQRNSDIEPAQSSSFTYYTSNSDDGFAGMLKTETIAPSGAKDQNLVTTYKYDSFGNVKRKEVNGWAGGSTDQKVTRFSSTNYDATGRFADSSQNALQHTISEVVERNEYGAATEIKGLNGMVSYADYDDWARELSASNNVGSETRTQYVSCPNGTISCPSHAKTAIIKRDSGSDNTNTIRSVTYFDLMGRAVRSSRLAFDGFDNTSAKYVDVDTEYDVLGRVVRVSEPYFSTGSPSQWTRNYFDELGNIILSKAPDGSEGKMAYSGYTTVTTNDEGQTKTETKNGFGELIKVRANDGGTIDYTYTTKGELRTTTANQSTVTADDYGTIAGLCQQPETNLQTVLCYDSLGRKSQMWDPDKGLWQYEYNAFGELIEQTDANGQRVELSYDILGRKKTRLDYKANNNLEGRTDWYFDDPLANAVGRPVSTVYTSDGNTYSENYLYDDYGQPEGTDVTMPDGNTYGSRVEYDYSKGRIKKEFDALNGLLVRNGSSITSGVEKHYTPFGFLGKITNLEDNAEIYKPEIYNARAQLTDATIGGNISLGQNYHSTTGLLANMSAVSGATVQKINYTWDTIGNLKRRVTASQALSLSDTNAQVEDFCYDKLNRLIKTYRVSNSSANRAAPSCPTSASAFDVEYDQLGNITRKASFSSSRYNYGELVGSHRAGPHALTSFGTASGRTKFTYDDNGNLLSDGARSFTYSTFNKPTQISNASHTVEFHYGPARKRYHRMDRAGSVEEHTWYLGNIEKVVKSGKVEWRRSVEGGGHYTYTTNTANVEIEPLAKRYMLKDHLGSSNLILEADGSLAQSFSFDNWGLRRNPNNMAALSNTQLVNFDTSITKRGYTGHEMVDTLHIIHMNGRIYDARWGRFLQADPFVQAPTDTQSLNRYSYVRNNPLNATDPEGYFWQALVMGAAVGWAAQGVAQMANVPVIGVIGSLVACASTANPIACSGGVGFGSTYAATGDLGKSVQSGAISAASAWAFTQIGKMAGGWSDANQHFDPSTNTVTLKKGVIGFGNNTLTPAQVALQIGAHAMVGGISAQLQGGKFGHGFVSAGVTKGIMGNFIYDNRSVAAIAGRTTVAALIGGTVSQASGGKFANGAVTAAIAHLFNAEMTQYLSTTDTKTTTYWRRKFVNGRLVTKLDAHGDPYWKSFNGDSEMAGVASELTKKVFLKALLKKASHADVAIKFQQISEWVMEEEYSQTETAITVWKSQWEFETTVIYEGPQILTGAERWKDTNMIMDYEIRGLDICALSCNTDVLDRISENTP
ncbi:RHS repeat-associated core domain-containing protein [Alteromonadaceae bacterium Bs31]|nr:RHS repeat-associated core domain-containing protein [Alteromonadaceae bacterium Bs31]